MGEVLLGYHQTLGRPTALKRLVPPDDAEDDLLVELEERFEREAKVLAMLDHPSIPRVFDLFSWRGTSYIAQEYVSGIELRILAESTPLPIELALGIGIQIADALEHAHQAGVIHRDVKPANIIVADTLQAKLMDFGIAIVQGKEVLTRTDTFVGTPRYMAPELLQGAEATPRSDVYSLGMTLYRALAGRSAFPMRARVEQVAEIVIDGRIPPLRTLNDAIPKRVAHVIHEALSNSPDKRPKDASVFRDLLVGVGSADQEDVTAHLPTRRLSVVRQKRPRPLWLQWLTNLGDEISEAVGAPGSERWNLRQLRREANRREQHLLSDVRRLEKTQNDLRKRIESIRRETRKAKSTQWDGSAREMREWIIAHAHLEQHMDSALLRLGNWFEDYLLTLDEPAREVAEIIKLVDKFHEFGLFEQAERLLRRSASIDPHLFQVLYWQYRHSLATGDIEEARLALGRQIGEMDLPQRLLETLRIGLWIETDTGVIIEAASSAVQQLSDSSKVPSPTLMLVMEQIRQYESLPKEVETVWARSLTETIASHEANATGPPRVATWYRLKALVSSESERLNTLELLAWDNSASATVLAELSMVLAKSGHTERARALSTRAVLLNPHDRRVRISRLFALPGKEASEEFRRLAEMFPPAGLFLTPYDLVECLDWVEKQEQTVWAGGAFETLWEPWFDGLRLLRRDRAHVRRDATRRRAELLIRSVDPTRWADA